MRGGIGCKVRGADPHRSKGGQLTLATPESTIRGEKFDSAKCLSKCPKGERLDFPESAKRAYE
ncbi:hypothetical protein Prudu_642S000200 [Prunus dulcis]|uniref:Uncharacterized protein n=1 Tax=Prunus dulcis TaxID=3755 RepID=A0A5H2XLG3_PRUDU|nr:hypothetical protein Prudu_642S000200 [Prunus dulcis]